jgi:TPR repeat protein
MGFRPGWKNLLSLALGGGLIEDRDCWGPLYEAARQAQAAFDSWEHLAASFNIGRRWWGHASPDWEERFHQVVARLLEHQNSPRVGLDWNTDLQPEKHPDLLAQAKSGDAKAQYQLGYKLRHGQGTKQDPMKALVWIERAARQGHLRAQNDLGVMYQLGEGTQPDRIRL